MNRLLDVYNTADLLSISPWTVRAYIKQGKLRPIRIGKRVLLEEAELERFLASCRQDGVRPGIDLPQAEEVSRG